MSPRTRSVAIALVAVAGSLWLGWRMLTAAFVGAEGKERVAHMSESCPSDSG